MADLYYEMVVEGPLPVIKGFVAGVLIARGLDPKEVLFATEHQIAVEPLREQLAEWLHLARNRSHLMVPAELKSDLRMAVSKAGSIGLSLVTERPVRSAYVDFNYAAFQPEQAAQLVSLIRGQEPALRISDDFQPTRHVDPDAKGNELYSPAHDFEVKAHGRLTGSLRHVLAFAEEAKNHPLLEISAIQIHHGDD